MKATLHTADVTQKESFDYWNDIVCNVFAKLDSKSLADTQFTGAINHHQLSTLGLSTVASTPVKVSRTKNHIAQTSKDYFKFSFQLAGEAQLLQDGRETHLTPGDWAFYDCTRPYTLILPQTYRQLVVQVPRHSLRSQIKNTNAMTATKMSGKIGLGRLAFNFVYSTKKQIDSLPSTAYGQIANTLTGLLVTGIGEIGDQHHSASEKETLLRKIKLFIEGNLTNPNLSIDLITKSAYISKRYLHVLFKDEGTTVSQYIRGLRLEMAGTMLADPRLLNRTVTEIALSCGFNNPTHFGRLFKQMYQVSPLAYRKLQLENKRYANSGH